LRKLLHQTFSTVQKVHDCPVNWKLVEEHYIPLLLDFFADRLDRYWSNQGFSYDTADALLPLLKERADDLNDLDRRIRILTKFRRTAQFDDLIIAFNRCNNLSKPALGSGVKPELFQEEEEKQLHQALSKATIQIDQFLRVGDYQKALAATAALRPPVDNLFDNVLVMTEDKTTQDNRVRLLNLAVGLFGRLAEFSRLVIPAEQGS